jgi:signal transduction histidine kinase
MKYRHNVFGYAAGLRVSAAFLCSMYSCTFSIDSEKADQREFDEQVVSAQENAEPLQFDEKENSASIVYLVNRAADFFKKNRLVNACHAFSHTNDFIEGEVYVYVMDMQGVFLAHGEQQELIWQNYYDYKDALGTPIAQQIIKKAREGGGWVTYEWRGASKISYVQLVEKDGKDFIVAAGYYPHSKQDQVVNLVKGAVEVVRKDIEDGRPIEQAFSTINYALGRFVLGDLYLYALRFDGLLLANASEPKYVGLNSLEEQDTRGVFINKEIIQKLKAKQVGEGVWVEYVSKRALKRAYAEKVVDGKGVEYFIACGYYPEAGRDKVTDLVSKGFQFMKAHGLSQAVKAFSRGRNNEFVYGDIGVFVYDLNGVVIAEQEKSIIGKNLLNAADEDGRFWMKEVIAKAKDGGGWIDFKLNKSFKSVYVEQIDLGVDSYIIGADFYPSSKRETMMLLAKSAVSFMQTNSLEQAFAQFVINKSRFIRGDLSIYVFDLAGNCYADGTDVEKIWDTRLDAKDDEGKHYVRMLIDASKAGATEVTYRMHHRPVVAHVERVEKDGTTFIVGSSFQK